MINNNMKISEIIQPIGEGGNVFKGQTGPINRENIEPTLQHYFAELKSVFPKKASIFNLQHFQPLGSVGKKDQSGDIDLAVSASDIVDKEMSPESIAEWGIDPKAVDAEQQNLAKRARSATPEQLRMKAFLKLLTLYINQNAPTLHCDEAKVTAGNIFGLFPQYDPQGKELGIGVQMDWMVGDLNWLTFSYYSSAYPKESNVKGLHRTQLMLSAFQIANLSFNHVSGVKDKESGEVVANDPEAAIAVLNDRLGTDITRQDAENYYTLHEKLKKELPPEQYDRMVNIYLGILDKTRADIPDDLQDAWLQKKDQLNLTGKFLPDTSKLKQHATEVAESGSAGAERVKTRADFDQFLKSYEQLIRQFPGFQGMKPSGSYNSNPDKQDFGDIDLIVNIQSDLDKTALKKQLIDFFHKQPDTVIVPFSGKYAGKRTYNSGEIVTVRYHDPDLGYSAQIDNIIALDSGEAGFKQSFLDWPAEKQGLILGLVKVATLENDPQTLFQSLGIKAPPLGPDQEYEFNLSSSGLQLRLVTYEPGTYKQTDRKVIWTSQSVDDVEKLLRPYDLSQPFERLLLQANKTMTNPRSKNRVKGVFQSMVSVKSGEQGTPKGAGKEAALNAVDQALSESLRRLQSLAGLRH